MKILKKFIAFYKNAESIGKTSIILCFINLLVFVVSLFYKFNANLFILIIDGLLLMLCCISFSNLSKKLNELNSIK